MSPGRRLLLMGAWWTRRGRTGEVIGGNIREGGAGQTLFFKGRAGGGGRLAM